MKLNGRHIIISYKNVCQKKYLYSLHLASLSSFSLTFNIRYQRWQGTADIDDIKSMYSCEKQKLFFTISPDF